MKAKSIQQLCLLLSVITADLYSSHGQNNSNNEFIYKSALCEVTKNKVAWKFEGFQEVHSATITADVLHVYDDYDLIGKATVIYCRDNSEIKIYPAGGLCKFKGSNGSITTSYIDDAKFGCWKSRETSSFSGKNDLKYKATPTVHDEDCKCDKH